MKTEYNDAERVPSQNFQNYIMKVVYKGFNSLGLIPHLTGLVAALGYLTGFLYEV